jgi:phosphatidylserine/phosphatidylglycerophosphate/cardiolipin synthase-like enzyme
VGLSRLAPAQREIRHHDEADCAAFAVRAINNAEREILVGAYTITAGSGIVGALVRAKERGVDVRLIADKTTPCERESGIEPLAAAGVPIWIDAHARIATMVIDSAVTLTGSMNWTRDAAVNSEDLNLISSPAVAAAYAAHWRDCLAFSAPFNRREDWCLRQTSLPMVYRVGSQAERR